jgi:hypothetical protein
LICLAGVTRPINLRVRSQVPSVGLGASDASPSRNGPSRYVQHREEARTSTSSKQPVSPISKPVTSSLPADKPPLRRLSVHISNHEPQIGPTPEQAPPCGFVAGPIVGPSSMNGSKSIHDHSMLITNATNTLPSSTPDSSQTPKSPLQVTKSIKTHPIASRIPPLPSTSQLPLLPILPSAPIHLSLSPVDYRAGAFDPPLGSVDANFRPVHPLPLPPQPLAPSISYVSWSKGRNVILGMYPDDKAGGTRGSFPKELDPPADPCRSLVMEILPRKFRTDSFVLEWLSQFTFRPNRYTIAEGKVFFEFEDHQEARFAWNSPRMGGIEGLQGVRVFWYHEVSPAALQQQDFIEKDNARTIEGHTLPQPHCVSDSPTDLFCDGHTEFRQAEVAPYQPQNPVYSPASLPQPPSPASFNVSELQDPGVVVTPQVEDNTPNSNNQKSLAALTSQLFSGDRSVPSPTSTTSSLVDYPDDQMAPYHVAKRNGPPGGASGFSRASTLSPTLGSIPPSPTPVSFSASPLSVLSPCFPNFSPRKHNSCVPSSNSDYQAPIVQNHQGLIQASRFPQVTQPDFNMAEARPLTPDLMEIVDDGPLAKEAALRQLVLQSRKRKVASAPVSQQPTPGTASTTTSKNALEEIAVNFIVDAITRPPPAKRMKITPPLAEWSEILEEHIQTTKRIMAQMKTARSEAEKEKFRNLLREKDRCVIRQQKLVSVILGMIKMIHAPPTVW